MNLRNRLTKPIFVLFTIGLLLSVFFGGGSASANEGEIDINVANAYTFTVENLKPGDWIPRNITIKNDGKQNFRYIAKLGSTKSSKLLEELNLVVKKDTTTLYEGKLKDFTAIEPRELSKGSEESLFFQVSMPENLGNDFQSSTADVEFLFIAEGTETSGETPVPVDNGDSGENQDKTPAVTVSPEMVNKLPNTATNNYNIVLIGSALLIAGSSLWLYLTRRMRKVH
ncbi:MAG: TasA family protein [Mesobacillus sp.]|jgi:LPXTG-motif cell wall-anchored protein